MATQRHVLTEPGLPGYAQMMADYHRAFAAELRGVVSSLPIEEGDVVVDLACGDGAYSYWLADRVGETGTICALDVSAAFLAVARRSVPSASLGSRIAFLRSDVHRPPVHEGRADLVWCAQSLYSLPDPVDSVRRMSRYVRPGGVVAVFESDEFHHVLLPWPIEIEAMLKAAEWAAYRDRAGDARKFYVGRSLPGVFREAGLPGCKVRTLAFHRQAPLDEATHAFLAAYLDDLRRQVGPYLDDEGREQFEALADPRSSRCLLADEDLDFTCLERLAVATRP
jgi:ubiquinone/menaquinone biosynthesis C-methylase UbiE